jgi:hypothetical protein
MFQLFKSQSKPVPRLPVVDYDEHFNKARQTLQKMGITDIKPVVNVKRKRKKKNGGAQRK